jgi:hypothetical protein
MKNSSTVVPTVGDIESGLIVEGQHYEFKGRVNLDEPRGKSNFIDDIVAFLNAGPGHLIIGVYEKKGSFERFEGMEGDRDAIQRRVTSIIQDNIDPKPLGIQLDFLGLETGGFLLAINLRDHRLRPYQNKITGGGNPIQLMTIFENSARKISKNILRVNGSEPKNLMTNYRS